VSLTVNIRQALKAEDARQVSMLLTRADAKTIASTAKELTGQEATELLEHLSKFASEDPRRLGVLIEWVREISISHASYLSSQSRTKLRLKPILDILHQRTADHSELVHMKRVTDAIIKSAKSQSSDVMTPTNTESLEPLFRWTAE
jgi:hypothetical protein